MQKNFVPFHEELPTTKGQRTFQVGGESLGLIVEANEMGVVECRIVSPLESGADPACSPHHRVLAEALSQLEEYFAGERMWFDVPLSPRGTDFQRQVWAATSLVPYGQVRSYWWVAVRMGEPRAVRAVGQALRANPVAIFVPCHRVVRQDGSLGGFRPGVGWKALLLAHEERHKERLYRLQWPSRLD